MSENPKCNTFLFFRQSQSGGLCQSRPPAKASSDTPHLLAKKTHFYFRASVLQGMDQNTPVPLDTARPEFLYCA